MGQSAVAKQEMEPNGIKQGTLLTTTNEGPWQLATHVHELVGTNGVKWCLGKSICSLSLSLGCAC